MGDQGIVASRVGEDSQGLEALRRMEELGLDIDHVQTDRERPTGTVKVEIEGDGVARFEIAHPVAWDFLAWTLDWQHLAARVDAVCFGSLAQRAEDQSGDDSTFPARGIPRCGEGFRRESASVLLLTGGSCGIDEDWRTSSS